MTSEQKKRSQLVVQLCALFGVVLWLSACALVGFGSSQAHARSPQTVSSQ